MELDLWSDGGTVATAAVHGAIIYVFALVAVRIVGRRTVSEMGAFDVVVTISLGTLLASVAVPSTPAVSDGAAVLGTFLVLQMAIAAARQRFPLARRIVDFSPQIVVRDGDVDLRRAPWTAQVSEDDVRSWLRLKGIDDVRRVRYAVLEPSGELAVHTEGADPRLFRAVSRVDRSPTGDAVDRPADREADTAV